MLASSTQEAFKNGDTYIQGQLQKQKREALQAKMGQVPNKCAESEGTRSLCTVSSVLYVLPDSHSHG